MIKIIYFITTSTIITIRSKSTEFLLVVGPSLKIIKKSKKITEMSDPVNALAGGIWLVFTYCFRKADVVSLECVL